MKFLFDASKPYELRASYQVQAQDIDLWQHVNNKVYLSWMEQLAWQHSLAVGIDIQVQQTLGKMMVVIQHELNYLAAAKQNELLELTTWLDPNEKRLGCCKRKRYYRILRAQDQHEIFNGHTLWACMDIKTQKACRLPQAFISAYFETP
ncbi:acyl-CoA thioesterase [Thiosulfativibrio zosterae]|uniref:Thioesterase n=1 Tax=Thiosulfativibrio zosterae TaxID=2675053 RepID=A0A6F8PPZ1_9GAMM|nr:acyl-CoA thioesterase [Thiosulfativibrio zosterae]BBP44104.1 hypothetical protein THMIRHAT_18500 [Thiosulfativibrio zosterae]